MRKPDPRASSHRGPRLSTIALKGLFLFGLWVLLSGKFDALHLGAGLASVALVLWLDHHLGPIGDDRHARIFPLRWLAYYLWLLWEMILSAVYVARAVLRPSQLVDPRLIRFRSAQPNVVGAVTLANSITLTPGTLTVDLEGDEYLVHALTPRTARDLLTGSMPARVARLFGDEPLPPVEELDAETGRPLGGTQP
jgi:multicomponent Na+:H+ antiporter subunit E